MNYEILGSANSEDKASGSQEGRSDKIEETDDETEITDNREKVHVMERDGDKSEHRENGVVPKEGPSEGKECHWEPGKVQWLELMEGGTKLSSKILVNN